MKRSGYRIRVYKDGDGHAYEIREVRTGELVRCGWGVGIKQAAYEDARRIVQELARADERRAA